MSNDTDEVVQEPRDFTCSSCSTIEASIPPRPKGWRTMSVKPLVGAAALKTFEVCVECLGTYDLAAIVERCTGFKQEGDPDAD